MFGHKLIQNICKQNNNDNEIVNTLKFMHWNILADKLT